LHASYALHGGMSMTDELSVDMTFGNVDWRLKRFAAL
jgi:hypothetical protein